jgi:hypothetical protein
MASYANANHQPIPSSSFSSGRARRLSPFPPAPKSVRVVSVFSEPQPIATPDNPASPKPETHHAGSWPLWLLAITVILALVALAVARSQVWNQLGI